jgi:3D (Asp-Asp-Asp) domain-containing protein
MDNPDSRWLKLAKKHKIRDFEAKLLLLCTLAFAWELSFPGQVIAKELEQVAEQAMTEQPAVAAVTEPNFNNTETEKPVVKPKKVLVVVATAYSSSVEETDDTPCLTANGFDVCANNQVNVVAANFLPFGTKIKIPELYGDRELLVQDRMNARYGAGRIDIWHPTKQQAKSFGVKRLTIEVY